MRQSLYSMFSKSCKVATLFKLNLICLSRKGNTALHSKTRGVSLLEQLGLWPWSMVTTVDWYCPQGLPQCRYVLAGFYLGFWTWGEVILGVGPVGIAHNLLEGVWEWFLPSTYIAIIAICEACGSSPPTTTSRQNPGWELDHEVQHVCTGMAEGMAEVKLWH